MTTFADLYLTHVAASYDKQMYLADLIENRNWNVDMTTSKISFGDDFSFNIQLLGTESYQDQSWLWGWANQGSNIPPELLEAGLAIKAVGIEQQIAEFNQPLLQLNETLNGHALALVASGLTAADCYYRGPYEGGAAFVLIKDPNFPHNIENPVLRIMVMFPQFISNLPISNHQQAFISYLDFYGLPYQVNGATVTVTAKNGNTMTAQFDQFNRLADLNGHLGAEQPQE